MTSARQAYRRIRRRLGRTAPGQWLWRLRDEQRRRVREARRRASRTDVFIVAERNHPRKGAPLFYQGWLDWLAEHDPELFARIEVAHMPAEPPPNAAVVHAWVQDPVRERNPVLFAQLDALEEIAERQLLRLVQPARALSNSIREVQYERLTRAGLRTPRVVPVGADFAHDLGGLKFPVVVRKAWGHQKGMRRLDSAPDVRRWLAETSPDPLEWVATEYIDVRCTDGNFRKYRYILFGDHGVCRHLIVSADWEVRPADRIITEDTIAEELEFVGGRCRQHRQFDAARHRLELAVAAFDYSFDRRGEMVVWEVNPYPDLSRPTGRPGEYLENSVVRTYEAFASLYKDELRASRSWRYRLP